MLVTFIASEVLDSKVLVLYIMRYPWVILRIVTSFTTGWVLVVLLVRASQFTTVQRAVVLGQKTTEQVALFNSPLLWKLYVLQSAPLGINNAVEDWDNDSAGDGWCREQNWTIIPRTLSSDKAQVDLFKNPGTTQRL